MAFPDGMMKLPGKALLLQNAINGTKQAAHDLHQLAKQRILTLEFSISVCNPCLFYR